MGRRVVVDSADAPALHECEAQRRNKRYTGLSVSSSQG